MIVAHQIDTVADMSKHSLHNHEFMRHLGRIVRAEIDEHKPDDAAGCIEAACTVYEMVEHHAVEVLREAGVDIEHFTNKLLARFHSDATDLDRIATRCEQEAEDAEYHRIRANSGLAG